MNNEIRQDVLVVRVSNGALPDYLCHLDCRMEEKRNGDMVMKKITIVNMEEYMCKGDAAELNEKVDRVYNTLQRQLNQIPHNVLPVKIVYDVSEASIFKTPTLSGANVKKYMICRGGNFNKEFGLVIKITRHILFQAVQSFLYSKNIGDTDTGLIGFVNFPLATDIRDALMRLKVDPPKPSDDENQIIAENKQEAIALATLLSVFIAVEDLGSGGYVTGRSEINYPGSSYA